MPTPYSGADAFPASYNIPSDGDTRNVASVNVALEALGDRTAYLHNRLGAHFMRTVAVHTEDDTAFPPTLQWSSSTTAGTFTEIVSAPSTVALEVVSGTVPSPGTSDIIFVDACFSVATNDNGAVASDGQFEWQYKIGGGSFTRVPASRVTVRDDGSASIVRNKIVCVSASLVTVGAGIYTFGVFGCSRSNTLSVNVVGSMNARLVHYGVS